LQEELLRSETSSANRLLRKRYEEILTGAVIKNIEVGSRSGAARPAANWTVPKIARKQISSRVRRVS